LDIKKAFNGSPVPNWAKLVALGVMIGIQACVVWFGQKDAVRTLVAESRYQAYRDSIKYERIVETLGTINNRLDRGYRQGNREHKRLWKAIGRPDDLREME
jgi:hypothetical protein